MSEAPQPPPTRPSDRSPAEPPDPPPTGAKRSRSIWTGAAVAAVAVLAFAAVGCGGVDDGEAAGTTPVAAATTTDETTTEEAPTATAPANQPQRVTVVVKNAKPVGGVVHAEIKQGEEVVLIVRADVEDEVHLHGYDLAANVAPGHPARIRFQADMAGEFEVELEERVVPIAELEVTG